MAESPSAAAMAGTTPESPMEGFTGFLERLPLGGRNGLIVAIIATILALTAVIWYTTRPTYKVLFSGLPEQETGRVIEELTKTNIPYRLSLGGTTIEIPSEKVYDVRLQLATLGLPKQNSGVGYEIFDNGSLIGMTDFMQRMNFQRALQGELSRTIESIASVNSARVHLVLPKKSLFVSEEKMATASVIMELSRPLSGKQSEGIVHLVSSAVEGLDENNVTLIDHKGNLIAGGQGGSEDGRVDADESMVMQRQVERSLEERAQAMLDKIVGISASGISKSIVRVTAELDLARIEQSKEIFDPDGQVARSEQFVNEASRGNFGVSGIPGVRPNDANDGGGAGSTGSNQSRDVERETINYEISKTIEKTVLPIGTIKHLSIAVLVDTKYVLAEDGKTTVSEKRTAEDMEDLKKIVERAIGYRPDRDTIEVTQIPFEPLAVGSEQGPKFWEEPDFYFKLALVLAVFLLLMVVLRPMVNRFLNPEKMGDTSGIPAAVAALEEQLLAEGIGTLPTEQPMRTRVPDRNIKLTSQMIEEHTEEAREIIRSWMISDT
ncbi:MAG: flagellar M-ring protein FliF [Magnetococcales bacterium]|nr:flagellar M-ring protein FliF [Magnetococcales bacterium]